MNCTSTRKVKHRWSTGKWLYGLLFLLVTVASGQRAVAGGFDEDYSAKIIDECKGLIEIKVRGYISDDHWCCTSNIWITWPGSGFASKPVFAMGSDVGGGAFKMTGGGNDSYGEIKNGSGCYIESVQVESSADGSDEVKYYMVRMYVPYRDFKVNVDGEWDWDDDNVFINSYTSLFRLRGPDAPTGVRATQGTECDAVNVSWTASAGESCDETDVYELYRNGTKIASTKNTEYKDITAVIGTHYKYSVKKVRTSTGGYNNSVQSPMSNEADGWRRDALPEPTDLATSIAACNDITVSWKWTTVPNNEPASFRVNNSVTGKADDVSGSMRSFVYAPAQTDIDAGTEFGFNVSAINQCGIVSWPTASLTGRTKGKPSSPTGIAANVVGNKIQVTWIDQSSQEDKFILQRTAQQSGETRTYEIQSNTTAATGSMISFTDNNVVLCQDYTYTVLAANNCYPSGNGNNQTASAKVYPNLSASLATFEASKGYYGNKIELNWTLNDITAGQVDQFNIMRRDLTAGTSFTLLEAVKGKTYFVDESAVGGRMYEYQVQIVHDCGGNIIYSNALTGMGFRIPFASVSGQVLYEDASATEGVRMMVEPTAGMVNYSLAMNGSSYITVPNSSSLNPSKITLEAWVQMSSAQSGVATIFSKQSGGSGYKLACSKTQLFFSINGTTLTADVPFNTNIYNHLAATYNGSQMVLYLNGEEVGAMNYSGSIAGNGQALIIGADNSMSNKLNGYIDHIRIWNVANDSLLVAQNASRYMGQEEPGLVLYYRVDENFGNQVFDFSKNATDFNKNEGTLVNCSWSTVVPSVNQLGYSAYTDSTGVYQITSIGYSGAGQNFKLVPFLGPHQFKPGNKTLYLGDGSNIITDQNFTDVSAYDVSGTVKYAGCACYVADVMILIDDRLVVKNGKLVTTDADGYFKIKVPIGLHQIKIQKVGHTFQANGMFPSSKAMATYPYFDFQDAVTGIEFIDSTQYTVVGRVVGGAVEAQKKPGLGLSKNNIGIAKLKFTAEQGGGCYTAQVTSDSTSGEYKVSLPPLRYVISSDLGNSALVVNNRAIDFGTLDVLDAATFSPEKMVIDTIATDIIATVTINHATKKADILIPNEAPRLGVPVEMIGTKASLTIGRYSYLLDLETTASTTIRKVKVGTDVRVDSLKYNVRRDFVYRSDAQLKVTAPDGSAFVGENSIIYRDIQTGATFPINLRATPFNYEVFMPNKEYRTKITLFEEYTNYDLATPVKDVVPVSDASVMVNNELSQEFPIQIQLKDGEALYNFNGGIPNVTANELNPEYNFTSVFQVVAQVGAKFSYWKPLSTGDKFFRGYVMGTRMIEGTDFVSSGPQVVDFILRDPPGSESSASISKGFTYSTTNSYSRSSYDGVTTNSTIGFAMEVDDLIGSPFAGVSIKKFSTEVSGSVEVTKEGSESSANEQTVTTSFGETFSTSGSPELAGSPSDLFVGRSRNILFGIGNQLTVMPYTKVKDRTDLTYTDTTTSGYTLALVRDFAIKPSNINTQFIYTQNHIETSIIPNLIALRNSLLHTNPDYKLVFTDMNDERFGSNNDDLRWGNLRKNTPPLLTDDNYSEPAKSDFSGPSYIWLPGSKKLSARNGKTDEVRKFNEQIRVWKSALARNEREKIEAEFEKNISYNAGVGYESETTINTSETKSESWDNTISVDGSFLANLVLYGFKLENETHFVTTETTEGGKSSTKESETTVYYTLSDPDNGDYFSVDVKKPKQFGGPVFFTQAGRTSCPYEAEEKPKYMYEATFYYRLTDQNIGDIDNSLKELNTAGSFLQKIGQAKVRTSLISLKDKNYKTAGDFQTAVYTALFSKNYAKADTNYNELFGSSYERIAERAMYQPTRKELGEAKLNEGTIQREKPILNVTPAIADRIPDDKPAVFKLLLGNEADEDGMYAVKIIEATNPYGAVIQVDGTDIEGRLFEVPANSSITKTLMISRGAPDVNNYDSIKLMIYSTCDYELYQAGRDLTIADTVWVSVHFVPACSDLKLRQPNDKFTVNYSNKTENKHEYLYDAVISDYDIENKGLKKIQLQYKPASSSQWIGLQTWWKDTLDIPEGSTDKALPSDLIGYKWDVTQLPDQDYELRAVSTCELSENYTLPLTGLMDRVNPTPFGSPQPADGVMSPGDELQINFNEQIFAGGLTYSNFDIRGVLNGTKLRHGAMIALDGDATKYAVTPEGINFADKSFSLECWIRRTASGEQCLISQGTDSRNGLWLGFNENGQLTFDINGQSISATSDPLASDVVPQWHHVVASYNIQTKTAQLILDGKLLKNGSINTSYKAAGRLYIGKRSYSNALPFNGDIHEMRVWYDVRTLAGIAINMNMMLSGKERGLAGNWRFDEAFGKLARDYASGRNALIVGAQWKVDPAGDAVVLNGSSDYVAVKTTDVAFGPEENFTIEFWFKGDGGVNQCLFSNGKGDGTDANQNGWSLITDADGLMCVKAGGLAFKATDSSVFDNQWHHFAMVVNRLANITTYIDGERQGEISSENWAEFGGAQLYLGALADVQSGGTSFTNFFNGSIDEFRVWSMSRKQQQIKTTMNNMMEGSETGLVLYLPFQKYTQDMGIYFKTPTLEDLAVGKHDVTASGTTFSGSTPAIKLPRPLSKVNFKWVTNGDKIILDITDPDPLIENCILDVVVNDVKDLHGNGMQSAATWSFFVNLNQMIWSDQDITLENELYKPRTFTSTIKNVGGKQQTYRIDNLPSWLTASPSSGTIEPLTSQKVTFTVNPALNIGDYNVNIYLSTDLGFSEKLPINLHIYKPEPTWTVDPSKYQYSQSVIGQFIINGIVSTDRYDKVGVFCGDECRGAAHLEYVEEYDRFLVYLDMYSNVEYGDSLKLKLWDASEGQIITKVIPYFVFNNNDVLGTPSKPINIVATSFYQGTIALKAGWNWMSFNLVSPLAENMNRFLWSIEAQDRNLIKSQSAFEIYSTQSENWFGTISTTGGIQNRSMYMMKLSAVDTLLYEGPRASIDSALQMEIGWNWIGFLPQVNLTTTDAFASFNPVSGDVVKSQESFSLYDNRLGWIGSLTSLAPGRGYMYRSSKAASFKYPESGTLKSGSDNNTPQMAANHNYPYTMPIIARVEAPASIDVSNLRVDAKVNEEVRASATAYQLDNTMYFFLNVAGETAGETLQFTIVDSKTGKQYAAQETEQFNHNEVLGSAVSPFVLTLKSGTTSLATSSIASMQVFENPFSDKLQIGFANITQAANLEIQSIHGVSLFTTQLPVGVTNFTWNACNTQGAALPAGVYQLKVQSGNLNEVVKIIKIE